MGFITNKYQKSFLQRYDRDEAIPYYSAGDFPGLKCERGNFENSAGVRIEYFTYYYEGYGENMPVLFCPGMGPGHTAYFSEIEAICRAGHRVLTLDYTGCGESGGDRMTSVNSPARDAVELLELLAPKEEIIPVGHSLGGYTALCVAREVSRVKRAVIISGFVGIAEEMMGFFKLRLLANRVKRFEKKLDPRYGSADNRVFLTETDKKLLWIHSTDDPMVNYRYNAEFALKTGNPNLRVITAEHKKHNPQYTAQALADMNAWMSEYFRLVKENAFETPEARKAYFDDKPISRMTELDPAVFGEVLKFIEG